MNLNNLMVGYFSASKHWDFNSDVPNLVSSAVLEHSWYTSIIISILQKSRNVQIQTRSC